MRAEVHGPPLELSQVTPVSQAIAAFARSRSDCVALAMGDERVTYSELERRIGAAAAALTKAGIGPGDVVALVCANHLRFFPLMLAAMRLSLILLPVNWRQKAREIGFQLADSGAKLVIVDDAFREVVELAAGKTQLVLSRAVDEEWLTQTPVSGLAFGDWSGGSLLFYTSGTTGEPKGVLINERALSIARAQEKALVGFADWTQDEVLLSPLPLFHIGGVSWALCGLDRGCTVVLTTDMSPAGLLEACQKWLVTRTFMVPQLVRGLIDEMLTRNVRVDSLKAIHYGAAAMDPPLLERGLKTIGCRFLQYFGMTEMCGTISILQPDDHDLARSHLLRSVGRPLPGTIVQIRNKDGDIVACGEPGEIWVRSETRMLGYRNRAKATAEAIVDGFYRTGDGGRIDEAGFLYLTDRIKDMINSGGENVYPAEVEAVLREHPAVGDCAVYGVPDATWGEAVHAAVERRPGVDTTEQDIVAHVRAQIAAFKAPKRIVFVDALPRTASGKVQRGKVRQAAMEIES